MPRVTLEIEPQDRRSPMTTPTVFHGAVALAIFASAGSGASQIPSDFTPVSGTIQSVSDSLVAVQTANGAVLVRLVRPFTVYAFGPSDLAHVTPHTFVGITSVKQADGSERASEIHILPEALRGTGEGSYMMGTTDQAGNPNRMTNGAVVESRMTNGSVDSSSDRSNGERVLRIAFKGGTQTITIPGDVPVTLAAPTGQPLTPGTRAYILATKRPDGTYSARSALLARNPSPGR